MARFTLVALLFLALVVVGNAAECCKRYKQPCDPASESDNKRCNDFCRNGCRYGGSCTGYSGAKPKQLCECAGPFSGPGVCPNDSGVLSNLHA